MNREEAQRIADTVNTWRPEWPVASLMTTLAKHQHRPARDVLIATVWIATDPATTTPGRLHEAGPWWNACRPAELAQPTPRPPRSDEACPEHPGGWRGQCTGCAADRRTDAIPQRQGSPYDRSGPNAGYLEARQALRDRGKPTAPQQPAPPAPIEPPDLAETGEHQ